MIAGAIRFALWGAGGGTTTKRVFTAQRSNPSAMRHAKTGARRQYRATSAFGGQALECRRLRGTHPRAGDANSFSKACRRRSSARFCRFRHVSRPEA